MKILLIIPAYNEEKNLDKVIEDITCLHDMQIDYLIVNDCSTDGTRALCERKRYNAIHNPINLGIGGTVQNGYQYAYENDYDIAIQVDGDGQHDPIYINKLIAPLLCGQYDIAVGSRYIENQGFQSTMSRRVGIRIISDVIYFLGGTRIKDVTSGFRAVNRRFIEIYANEYPQDYPEPEAILMALCMNGRIAEVPVIMRERISGESSINVYKSVYYMIKVVLSLFICKLQVRGRRNEH